MTTEEELKKAVKDYRAFICRGGNKGSVAGRARRGYLSSLVVRIKDERAFAERFTQEDEIRAVEHIDVFG